VVRILVSNDDGIEAPGIAALAEAMGSLGEVWVVAPDSERSAQSHALTMHKPLRASRRGERSWSVSGTPADCVYFAVHHLMPERPAVVVSGINNGSNLGNDVFYSGTVAAAMEGCFHGVPAVAVSLHRPEPIPERHWETGQLVAKRVVERVLAGVPPRLLLNVNVPNIPPERLLGVKAAVLGERRYAPMVALRHDPRGREYFWIGGDHEEFVPIEGSDGPAVEQGWATVTPIHPDLTMHGYMPDLRRWTDE
jgi:5'-nucleotidase